MTTYHIQAHDEPIDDSGFSTSREFNAETIGEVLFNFKLFLQGVGFVFDAGEELGVVDTYELVKEDAEVSGGKVSMQMAAIKFSTELYKNLTEYLNEPSSASLNPPTIHELLAYLIQKTEKHFLTL